MKKVIIDRVLPRWQGEFIHRSIVYNITDESRRNARGWVCVGLDIKGNPYSLMLYAKDDIHIAEYVAALGEKHDDLICAPVGLQGDDCYQRLIVNPDGITLCEVTFEALLRLEQTAKENYMIGRLEKI